MAEVLPPLYQRWIDQLLPEGIPSETRATCGSCAMLPGAPGNEDGFTFNPTTKCCTFHPDLQNFVVGRILADDQPETEAARRTLERRIAARIGVTPLSIAPQPVYQVLYAQSALALAGGDVFGRAESLRCPFYLEQGGQCGIWRHRESVCSTFFCKFSRGPAGSYFWRALAGFLQNLENALRIWALNQIDPSAGLGIASLNAESRKPRGLDQAALAGAPPPGVYETVWGSFLGREVELYRACADAVNKLDLPQVLEVGGEVSATGARTLVQMHKRLLAGELPARLARGNNHLIQVGRRPNQVRLKSATLPYDFVDLPVEALDAATRVVGRPLADARDELRAQGRALDDETLRWLIDFEVLVPA